MKLAIIQPCEMPTEAWKPLENEINRIVSPGTEIALFDIKGGKVRVASDIDLSAPAAVKLAVDAEKNGFDAIVLDGT